MAAAAAALQSHEAAVARAASIIAGSARLPTAVLVDLDKTVWPYWLDYHADGPPFRQHPDGTTVADRRGKQVKMFPETPAVLTALHQAGIPVLACSRSSTPDWCRAVIELYVLDPASGLRFRDVLHPSSVIRTAESKLSHLRDIRKALNVPFNELLFFDDERYICEEGESLGVHCVQVDREGLCLRALEEGFGILARL